MRKKFCSAALAALLCGSASLAFAQANVESKKLPSSFLKGVVPKTAHVGSGSFAFGTTKKYAGTGDKNDATSGLPGVDSVANWSDDFTAPGFDSAGNPQSVWPYTMVGAPPESGRSTKINAPIVPVTVDLLLPNGKVAVYHGHPLTFAPDAGIVKAVVNSPVFEPFHYLSGVGQFNDQMMRTQFWNRIHSNNEDEGENGDSEDGWHTNLAPSVKTARRMQIPYGFWLFGADANNIPLFAVLDGNEFSTLLFPPAGPVDNSTIVGAAELAGNITTRDISTFLFNNVVLGDSSNCCVIGFHTYDSEPGDSSNGNRERRYVLNYSSWISNGLFFFGFEDITPLSHEMSETFDDPFVNNATPWWLSVDPFLSFEGLPGSALCQNNLETGDVIEVLTANPVYPIAMDGRTYHPQNEALLPWFAFQSPSQARHGAYSFPDETTLTALSPGNLLPGCTPAH